MNKQTYKLIYLKQLFIIKDTSNNSISQHFDEQIDKEFKLFVEKYRNSHSNFQSTKFDKLINLILEHNEVPLLFLYPKRTIFMIQTSFICESFFILIKKY